MFRNSFQGSPVARDNPGTDGGNAFCFEHAQRVAQGVGHAGIGFAAVCQTRFQADRGFASQSPMQEGDGHHADDRIRGGDPIESGAVPSDAGLQMGQFCLAQDVLEHFLVFGRVGAYHQFCF